MDDDAERKSLMSRPIPARPKGAVGPTPPPPLDEFIQKRQSMKGPAFAFNDPEEPPPIIEGTAPSSDPFADFAQIMRILRRHSKLNQAAMMSLIADLLNENPRRLDQG